MRQVINAIGVAFIVFALLCTCGLATEACVQQKKGKVKLKVPKTSNISSSSNKICQQNGDEKVCYRKNNQTGQMELIKAQ